MDATLVLASLTQAYSDTPHTATPAMKSVDWASQVAVAVANAKTDPYKLAPGDTLSVFNGVRSTAVDGTTQFSLALSTLSSNRYRFTATAGTAPAFRTDRGLALATQSVTVTVNSNQTATVSANASAFSAVQVGDLVLIPGPSTGDAATVFNALNEGAWSVLSVATDGSSVQVTRLADVSFAAVTETVTVGANSQLVAFSAAGVQVGDQVNISAGFSASVQKSYTVAAVTPSWFEIVSTAALPVSAVATPGAAGIQFYSAAKRYIRILADQECIPRLNGDTGNSNRVSPWTPGDRALMGEFVKVGPTWSLTVQNASQSVMNLVVVSAE